MGRYKDGTMVCRVCKKRFLPAPFHAWKIALTRYGGARTLVCSYSCMRAFEKAREEARHDKRRNNKGTCNT